MRHHVQLKLIEEVNNQKTTNKNTDLDNDDDTQLVPREGNIGVRSSLIDYNNQFKNTESRAINKKTRAQMVPKSETLAPVFKNKSNR